jgi:hypothetical protein
MYVNAKMIPFETIIGMGVRRIKEIGRRGECKHDIFNAS